MGEFTVIRLSNGEIVQVKKVDSNKPPLNLNLLVHHINPISSQQYLCLGVFNDLGTYLSAGISLVLK